MKVYLAGMENAARADVVDKGIIDNAFYSYYYLRGKKAPVTLISGRKRIKNIILDSGAHSFFAETLSRRVSASVHVKKTKTKETPAEYFEEYVRWLKQWGHLVDYFVELDIGELVGQDTVMKWRETFKQEGLYNKCITVYHPEVITFEEYLKMLDDSQSRYVALEGVRPGTPMLPYLRLIKEAFDRKVKVHGFAFLKRKGLLKFPFYSVDGSSWLTGTQWGASIAVIKNKIKQVRFIQKSEDLFALSQEVDNLIEVLSDDPQTQREKRLEIAVDAYKLMQSYYTALWDSRGVHWID